MSTLDDIKARTDGHTEGPWEALSGEWGTLNKRLTMLWAGQRDENEFMVATAFAESKADAALIAAAPKLLAALEAVEVLHIPVLECGDPVGCRACDWGEYEGWPCQTLLAINEALEETE